MRKEVEKMLKAGIQGRQEVMVTEDNSASALGSGSICNTGHGGINGKNGVDERRSLYE